MCVRAHVGARLRANTLGARVSVQIVLRLVLEYLLQCGGKLTCQPCRFSGHDGGIGDSLRGRHWRFPLMDTIKMSSIVKQACSSQTVCLARI